MTTLRTDAFDITHHPSTPVFGYRAHGIRRQKGHRYLSGAVPLSYLLLSSVVVQLGLQAF